MNCTTHYLGCACHEATRDAEIASRDARIGALEAELARLQEQPAIEALRNAQQHLSALVRIAKELFAQSEEYETDDGIMRASPIDLWHMLYDVLDNIDNDASQPSRAELARIDQKSVGWSK